MCLALALLDFDILHYRGLLCRHHLAQRRVDGELSLLFEITEALAALHGRGEAAFERTSCVHFAS